MDYSKKYRVIERIIIVLTLLLPHIGLGIAIYQLWLGTVNYTHLCILFVFGHIIASSITIGFHRYFTHKSFQCPVYMQYILGILGSMNGQGGLLRWVANHRRHHRYTDQKGDPHSPYITQSGYKGSYIYNFIHGYILWTWNLTDPNLYHEVKDLRRDPVCAWISKHYLWCMLLGLILPGLLGMCIGLGFWDGLIWGGLVRIALTLHFTWQVNVFSHSLKLGEKIFKTSGNDVNCNWFPFGLGEQYHNNHHSQPRSAKFGWTWKQCLDIGWFYIYLMEKIGLVYNVNRPILNNSKVLNHGEK